MEKAQRVQVNIRIDKDLSDRIVAYLHRRKKLRHGDKSLFLEGLISEGMNRREASEKGRKPR